MTEDTTSTTKEIVGTLEEIASLECIIRLTKREWPATPFPLDDPSPIYVKDEKGQVYLIYAHQQSVPSADLPTQRIIDEGNEIVIDPAKELILGSDLAQFVGLAVIIPERAVPVSMAELSFLLDADLPGIWEEHGFFHLRLVAKRLDMKFTPFLREFARRFAAPIKNDKILRSKCLEVLVQIGAQQGLSNQRDYCEVVKEFAASGTACIALEDSSSGIKALIVNEKIEYGDPICFDVCGIRSLAIVADINLHATLVPIIAVKGIDIKTFPQPLRMGIEGSLDGVKEVIEFLFDRVGEGFFKVPIGMIPKTGEIYYLLIKGNERFHFATVAISGSGKGNMLKRFIYALFQMHAQKASIPGFVLFDDVGEYVRSLKPQDWGIEIGALVSCFTTGVNPPVDFVDVGAVIDGPGREYKEDSDKTEDTKNYEFLKVTPKKIPLEYIPRNEITRSMEDRNLVAAGVIPAFLREYYQDKNHSLPLVNDVERPDRLNIEFVNWFILEINAGHFKSYNAGSCEVAARNLSDFLFKNQKYLGIEYYRNDDGVEQWRYRGGNAAGISDDYNLIACAKKCEDQGRVLVIDESSLNPETKLLIQRILLNDLVERREIRGFDPHIHPCLFVIEEATALMRGKSASQLDLFAEAQVRCRKFGIGIGLVLQDIHGLDTSLLNQLGFMVAMGLPVDAMRSALFKNVPADLGPYDHLVKYANVGTSIIFQQCIGKNLPLPVQIDYYEQCVWEDLKNMEGGFDEELQESLASSMHNLGIPAEVANKLIVKATSNKRETSPEEMEGD